MKQEITSASTRYRALESGRSSVLTRARESAKLTIPVLMPPDGHGETSTLPTPFQGIGARGVNNLSSKLLLALLPPNSPFFRLGVDDFTLVKLTQREGMRAEVEAALSKIERSVMSEIETSALRVSVFEALKQLIVCGNVLLFLPPEGGMRVFRLDRYVVKRDPMGNVLEHITKEEVSPDVLPASLTDYVRSKDKDAKIVSLYTRVVRTHNSWQISQEVAGKIVPGSLGSYPLDRSPWIPLRMTKVDGEDYGRGYVEEYLGDIRSLEGLTQAIVEGSAAAAKILFLVNPNGTTKAKTLAESPNGAVRQGNALDVTVVQANKYADFRVAQETAQGIEQRLAFAFLLNSSIQRGGERVTAEEIRFMAGELEDALGGVYSILSQELQLPLVNRLMFQMERQGRLPVLPKGIVKPAITTGLEALGRGHDMNKLRMFGQIAAEAANLPMEINRDDYLKRAGASLGIDMAGLVKTPEEIAAEREATMQQQMLDKLGPKGMDIIRDQMNKQGTPND